MHAIVVLDDLAVIRFLSDHLPTKEKSLGRKYRQHPSYVCHFPFDFKPRIVYFCQRVILLMTFSKFIYHKLKY